MLLVKVFMTEVENTSILNFIVDTPFCSPTQQHLKVVGLYFYS